ncbi:hypothetical protein OPT61_g4165 [Boeremia exigua]|uniref:Uncharacterized protein n=1 Tax=Boeremia exigua TaxID=749465 RepID=A0ACC2IF45_9PLEO|nr:hypothetical protein OPT61_g4165 [Boeremia exigua]
MPRADKTEAFNAEMQKVLQKSSFADPNCASWYKNAEGKITNNWSGTVVEYQHVLSKVDWEDFETTKGERASGVVFGGGKKETRVGRVHEESYVSNTTLLLGVASTVVAGAAWYAGLGKRVRFGR